MLIKVTHSFSMKSLDNVVIQKKNTFFKLITHFFNRPIKQSKFWYWFKNDFGMEFSILDHCVDTDPTCLARSHTLPTTILFSGFGFFFRKEERIFTKLNQTRVCKIFYQSAVYLQTSSYYYRVAGGLQNPVVRTKIEVLNRREIFYSYAWGYVPSGPKVPPLLNDTTSHLVNLVR